MSYPGRQNIYEATIRRMVQEALARQEQEFLQQHGSDSDETLLRYLRSQAAHLRHTPQAGEIVGELLILQRFGTWERACSLAGLPLAANSSKDTFARVRQETLRQKELYRQRKSEKKEKAARKRSLQVAKKRPQ